MSRDPVEETILGLRVITQPLVHDKAKVLLPDIMQILSIAGGEIGALLKSGVVSLKDDISKLTPIVGKLGVYLANGKLEWLEGRMLASTEVHADGLKFELMKDQERSKFFTEHPEMLFPLLWTAGVVTFRRFLPAGALLGGATRAASA